MMSNAGNQSSTAVESAQTSSKTTKLIHAAALAAMLVPLASVAVETSTIDLYCTSSTAGSGGCPSGSYSPGGSNSHTWGFFTNTSDTSTLLYTLQISGTPTATFSLGVIDRVVEINSLGLGTGSCIPTFDATQCGLFNVFNNSSVLPADMWDSNGYLMTIAWFPNANPLSSALLNQNNTSIKKAENFEDFTETLAESQFFPGSTPTSDPGLSGRGDGFSGFAAFTTASIPEPATLTLIGLGVSGLVYRARGRNRRS